MNDKVLIIEDQEETLVVLSASLKSAGYQVKEAANSNEGLKKFREFSPDLVIIDLDIAIQMSIECLRQIKNSSIAPEIIILAEQGEEPQIIELLRNGAHDYMLKPVGEVDLLLFCVKRALEKRELIRKNKLLVSQLRQVAIKDPLTGLYNYRYLQSKLSEEIIRSRRYARPFCVFVIDIDNFKSINHEFGHLFGDHILKKMGEILLRNIRKVDSVFRYGGDEFFILLPETNRDIATGIAMRLLLKIRDCPFSYEGYNHSITASIGSSMFPDKAEDKHELLALAEKALLKAKGVGGDTVFFE